jgi:hypothetical protein
MVAWRKINGIFVTINLNYSVRKQSDRNSLADGTVTKQAISLKKTFVNLVDWQ